MIFNSIEFRLAQELDALDELANFRDEFIITDPDLIYLDGNSLGRLPKRTLAVMQQTVEHEWGERLIRGWNDGWIHMPVELGGGCAACPPRTQ
jgi:kynureninase